MAPIPAAAKRSLVLGSTGAVGRNVFLSALASSSYSSVTEVGRRSLALSADALGKEKAHYIEVDFDNLDAAKLRSVDADAVLIALGTSRAAAGSAKAFERIDREYVLAAGKAAATGKPGQRIVYCSSVSSNPSSPFLYLKSKGLTEQGLASLGYTETIIFRPAFLAEPQRSNSRAVESVIGFFMHHVISRFSAEAEIPVTVLGHAMVRAAEIGIVGMEKAGIGRRQEIGASGPEAWVVGNGEAVRLANLAD